MSIGLARVKFLGRFQNSEKVVAICRGLSLPKKKIAYHSLESPSPHHEPWLTEKSECKSALDSRFQNKSPARGGDFVLDLAGSEGLDRRGADFLFWLGAGGNEV